MRPRDRPGRPACRCSEREAGLDREGAQGRQGRVEERARAEGVAGAHPQGRLGRAALPLDAGEAAAIGELLQQALRALLDLAVDQDRVVGSVAGCALLERADLDGHAVARSCLGQALLRGRREAGERFEGDHLDAEAAQERGAVAEAGSDLEDAVAGLEGQRLDQAGEDHRGRHEAGLAVLGPDRLRLVDIGEGLPVRRHEPLAGDGVERVEERDVGHVERPELAIDHEAARLRVVEHERLWRA